MLNGSWKVRFTFGLVILIASLTPVAAQAQNSGITVVDEFYSYTFAKQAVFEIEIESDLREANLFYTIEGELGQHFQRAEISESHAKAEISLTSGQIPPASQVTYFWRLENTRGQFLRTREQSFRYLDERFSWKNRTRDDVTVFWYGRDSTGDQILDQADISLVVVENLLGLTQNQPIRIVIYQNWSDMRPAVVERWGEHQVVSLGVAMNMQTAVLFTGISWEGILTHWERTLTHELTHVLTSQLTEGPYDRLPFWLSEGLATYTEGQTRGGTQNPLSIGLLSSGPTKKEDIGPAYAQAQSLVTFLVQEHGGKEKILELLTTAAKGETVNDALSHVYGFDQHGLESKWRAWLGEPIEELPQPILLDQLDPMHLVVAGIFFLALCLIACFILLHILKRAWKE